MTTRRRFIAAFILCGITFPLFAHGPTPQRAEQRIEIKATAEAVWAVLGNPATYAEWHPDVASAKMKGNGTGAKRTVEFKAGGSVVDGIDRIDEATKEIRWRLATENKDAFPASYYTNTFKIEPANGGSTVVWSASFFRADTTNEPPEGFSDQAAVSAMEGLISHGLAGLKAKVEGSK